MDNTPQEQSTEPSASQNRINPYTIDKTSRDGMGAFEDTQQQTKDFQLLTLEGILSVMTDQIYMVDRSLHLTYANRACLQAMGKSKEQVIGKKLKELDQPSEYIER